MAFLVFEERSDHKLYPTREELKLGGHGLIFQAWNSKGKPVNRGWEITKEQLLALRFPNDEIARSTRHLLIDYDPSSEERIGLVEPLVIYVFVWGSDKKADWTVCMLKMRDVIDLYLQSSVTPEAKQKILAAGIEPMPGYKESVEFLYLKRDWNWGRVGLTNAAFIQAEYTMKMGWLAATEPFSTPAAAFEEARKIVDNKIEGPRK